MRPRDGAEPQARPADGFRLNADLALGVLHAMLADFGSTSLRLPICVFQ